MGIEDMSEEEFEAELERKNKSRLKNKIILGAALLAGSIGAAAFTAYALKERMEGIRNISVEASVPRHPKQIIERIVNDTNTPEDAFSFVRDNIEFPKNYDRDRFGYEYWSSLQEMYGLGKGDCEDGAIGFAALLSDNPEYNITLAAFSKEGYDGHMIALYRNNESKWGIVSFNKLIPETGELSAAMYKAVFNTADKAVRAYSNGNYDSYYTVEFNAEQLKYGRNLQDDEKVRSETINLRQANN